MKKLRNLIAVMAAISMATVFTGCGDDDEGDDNDNGGNQGPQIVAPSDEAALTAQNKIYTASVAGQNDSIVLRFPAAGQYEATQAGATETGTISGAARTDNTWTMNLTPAAGQAGAQEGVLRMDFTAANAGVWTFTPTGGQAETGTFTLTEEGGGGNNGGTNGGTTGGTAGVEGKTLQLTYPNGGGEKFQFTSASAVSYENGTHAGTYTYDATNKRINVTLANGWLYEITLTDATNATVVFRQNAGDAGNTDAATYTLQ